MIDAAGLAEGVLRGEARAIARAISRIEDGHAMAPDLLARLHPHAGRAWTIGVTGPPGAGKSTLVDRLAACIRADGPKVAVVAVDPASPFTGGAILGDRVRMLDVAGDPGVYVRSMSSRGHLGGTALATEAAVSVLDAAGFEVIVVETVGVGQSEIEVAELADTTILVQPPHLGDGVQAVKAGIMEVPQLFVVNKADLPGAKQQAAEIEGYLELVPWAADRWRPPVLMATATSDQDHRVGAVWQFVKAHRAWCGEGERLAASRADRARKLLWREAERRAIARLRASIDEADADGLVADMVARRLTPGDAAEALLNRAPATPRP